MMITCQRKKIAKKWQCNDLRNSKYDPFAVEQNVTLTSAVLESWMLALKSGHASFRNIV